MMRALTLAEDGHPTGIDLVETELLGTLMVCPALRLECSQLRPSDFASPFRGAAFTAIMSEPRPSLGLVVARLETDKALPPSSRTGWGDAMARVISHTFVEDECVPTAVRVIREAALSRRAKARLHAT